MTINKYQSGARFERRVLKYLIGNNTSTCTGCLHTLIPAVCHDSHHQTPPLVYGIRAAGSRGDYDLLVVITLGNLQYVLGVQCKTSALSENRMRNDLHRIYKAHGIVGVYSYRDGRKIIFYPTLDDVVQRLLG